MHGGGTPWWFWHVQRLGLGRGGVDCVLATVAPTDGGQNGASTVGVVARACVGGGGARCFNWCVVNGWASGGGRCGDGHAAQYLRGGGDVTIGRGGGLDGFTTARNRQFVARVGVVECGAVHRGVRVGGGAVGWVAFDPKHGVGDFAVGDGHGGAVGGGGVHTKQNRPLLGRLGGGHVRGVSD